MPTAALPHAAVRVLPPSRPHARSWVAADVLLPAPEPVAEPGSSGAPGGLVLSGASWAPPVDDTLPDAVRWSAWFAVALGEAVLGRRPATRLEGWVSAQVHADLARGQRLRPAEGVAVRPVLLSGRVQHPAADVAEVGAVLRVGPRLLVLPFRLEAADGEWVCTAFQAGLTPGPRTLRRAAASPRSPAPRGAAAPVRVAGTR